jgi:hypothetical protein
MERESKSLLKQIVRGDFGDGTSFVEERPKPTLLSPPKALVAADSLPPSLYLSASLCSLFPLGSF